MSRLPGMRRIHAAFRSVDVRTRPDLLGFLHDAGRYLRGKSIHPDSGLVGAHYFFFDEKRLAVLVATPDLEVPDRRTRVPPFPALIALPE